ncbi:hypothetical protein MNV49_004720 [Pseudohyphozyma bogoriensis]|nr:hypothetical protein MNV49_004720 [Pseudohyphozyma bogoriensis]
MSLSSCCVTGHLHEGTPKGSVEKLYGVDAYVTGDESNKNKTILFITDVFGFALNNARLLADEIASNGFYVVIPDLFNGDAIDDKLLVKLAPRPSAGEVSKEQHEKDVGEFMETAKPWLGKHPHEEVLHLVETFAKTLRTDGTKLGATGYCFGGRYSILLAGEGMVDCAVAMHPSFLEMPSEIEAIKKPVSIAVGSIDELFPTEAQETTRKIFDTSLKSVDTELVIFDNQTHGFSIRADINNASDKEAKDKATVQTVNWFKKHLA